MTTNPKCLLKGEFARFQTSSILFSFIWFVKRRRNYLELNPKGRYQSSEKEKENLCVLFTYSLKWAREIRTFHVAIVQRRLRNVQKRVMHVKICCFANINLFFLPFSLPSPLLKLSIVLIPKFCYHGNVTSHFSLLESILEMVPQGKTGLSVTTGKGQTTWMNFISTKNTTFSCPLPVSFKLPDFFFKNISLVHQFVSSDNTQNTSLN